MDHLPGYFSPAAQQALLAEIVAVIERAPLFTPRMPRTGKPFSVRMTNCGPLGWLSDREGGYRYQETHPETGAPWPHMPEVLLDLWAGVSGYPAPPQACLVNVYGPKARMGLHRDEDEEDFSAPVVSVSLGDTALFRVGGRTRKGPSRSFDLVSGDVLVLGGEDRLAYHGVDRVKAETGPLDLSAIPGCARVNLTLRRVTRPAGSE